MNNNENYQSDLRPPSGGNFRPRPNFRDQPYHQREPQPYPQRERPVDEIIVSEFIQVERKSFDISLRKNRVGEFIRITEDVGGRFNTVIIPTSGAEQFFTALSKIADALKAAQPPQ